MLNKILRSIKCSHGLKSQSEFRIELFIAYFMKINKYKTKEKERIIIIIIMISISNKRRALNLIYIENAIMPFWP